MTAIQSYYHAALTGLRYLEHRAPTGRRFGRDADLLWGTFRGHLADVDRIDLLLRDADAEWPGALGARRVFDLRGVPEDDAFGKDWAPLDPIAGADLWRAIGAEPPPPDLASALTRLASIWGRALAPCEHDPIAPSTRLVVAGPSAVAALARAFEGRSELDWADQVAVVASDPGVRQLAAFCAAALNVTKPAILLSAVDPEASPALRGRALLVSEDADAADAAYARAQVGA